MDRAFLILATVLWPRHVPIVQISTIIRAILTYTVATVTTCRYQRIRFTVKKLILLLLLVMLPVAVVMANGTDDRGEPNDPTVNERANACYDGGSMADSGCETDWEWECGWHLIRWQADNTYPMPATCLSLLPVVVQPIITNPICVINATDSIQTMDSTAGAVRVTIVFPTGYINNCGDLTTPSVIATNAFEVSPNAWGCQTGKMPYEIRVVWTSASGGFTDTFDGDCL
jgi:hypothetical protein